MPHCLSCCCPNCQGIFFFSHHLVIPFGVYLPTLLARYTCNYLIFVLGWSFPLDIYYYSPPPSFLHMETWISFVSVVLFAWLELVGQLRCIDALLGKAKNNRVAGVNIFDSVWLTLNIKKELNFFNSKLKQNWKILLRFVLLKNRQNKKTSKWLIRHPRTQKLVLSIWINESSVNIKWSEGPVQTFEWILKNSFYIIKRISQFFCLSNIFN